MRVEDPAGAQCTGEAPDGQRIQIAVEPEQDGTRVARENTGQAGPEGVSRIRALIVEDDLVCCKALQAHLRDYAECDVAVNGREAVEAVRRALGANRPYQLVCLDIAMPEMDGKEALRAIRQMERERGVGIADAVRIVMTTVNDTSRNIIGAYKEGCEAYIVKPVAREKLLEEVRRLGLIR